MAISTDTSDNMMLASGATVTVGGTDIGAMIGETTFSIDIERYHPDLRGVMGDLEQTGFVTRAVPRLTATMAETSYFQLCVLLDHLGESSDANTDTYGSGTLGQLASGDYQTVIATGMETCGTNSVVITIPYAYVSSAVNVTLSDDEMTSYEIEFTGTYDPTAPTRFPARVEIEIDLDYLLLATFDWADDQGYADAQVLDTAAEGVEIGQLTVVEQDGTLAVVSNECAFTAQGTPAWGDLCLVSQAITRNLGTALLATVNLSTWERTAVMWFITTTPGSPTGTKHALDSSTTDGVVNHHQTAAIATGLALSTDYPVALLLGGFDSNGLPYYAGQTKANYKYGCWYFMELSGTWTLLWLDTVYNNDPMYAMFSNHSSVGTFDRLRVPDSDLSAVQAEVTNHSTFTASNGTSLDAITPEVGGTWTEQSGNWDIQTNRANPDGAAIATVDSALDDALIDCVVNGGVADQPAIVLRFSDTSNYWYLQADRANNQFELHEYNATVDTVRANAAVVINDSTDYELRAIPVAQVITGYLDSANRISYGSAALNENTTVHGIRAENTAGRFDNFAVFPRTSSVFDTQFDAV